jgi:putative membrane protein
MFYDGYHFWGMHIIWWIVWLSVIFWIFAIPYDIPGQRKRNLSPLDILRNRLALGQITTEEYREKRHILETDLLEK